MHSQVQLITDALMGPLQAGLNGLEAAFMPLWSSLISIAFCLGCLGATFGGIGGLAQRAFNCTLASVLAIQPVIWAPEIIEWSIGQAGTFAGLAGADAAVTPYEVMETGFTIAGRAWDHADALANYLSPSSWILAAIVAIAGLLLFLSYALITLLVISAWVEIYAAAILLLPLFTFLVIGGFGPAALAGPSFIVSATIRMAAFAFLATAGLVWANDPTFAIPPTSEPITWSQTALAVLLAFLMAFFALRVNALVIGIAMGRAGFSEPYTAIVGAVAGGVRMAMSGGSVGGAARPAGGGSGGAGGGGGGGGAGGGNIGARATPVNSRMR